MKTLFILLLLLLPIQDEYKWGRPTSKGVDNYIERNEYQFIIDYQNHIKDTLFYEPFISTDDLSDYYNYTRGDMGYYEPPDNIIINNEPRYIEYELSRLNDFQKSQYRESNKFVRAVVMHELTHCYFYQQIRIAEQNHELEYEFRQGLRIVPVNDYGTDFVEEGICEYQTLLMGEMIGYDEELRITKGQLLNNKDSYEVKYRYSAQYVKPIVDKLGLRQAIYLMVTSKPPSTEEILKPNLYYQRLNVN